MSRYTEKTEISYDDYLRLEGLLTIGRDLEQQTERVIQSIRGILGEDENGHAADAVYNGYTARVLLEKSDIDVLPPAPPDEEEG